jgi:hypothetical protein
LLAAAAALLKKAANAEKLRPAELVSVAKLQHVLSILPRVITEVEKTATAATTKTREKEIILG